MSNASFILEKKKEVFTALKEELSFSNDYQVPSLKKIVINVGVGDATTNAKLLDEAVQTLTLISGQKPVITRAKKSIAGFKIREGMPIGLKVTLRGERMYAFMSKLVGVAMPRIRDFRGLNDKGFDGKGNYNMGLADQLIFPEIKYDSVSRVRGMNITFVTSSEQDVHARLLLSKLGLPFKAKPSEQAA